MKKYYMSIMLAAILIAGITATIEIKNEEQPISIFASNSWSDEVLNNSFIANHSDTVVTGHVIKILPSSWNTADGKKPVSTDKKASSKEESEAIRNENIIYTDALIKVDEKIKNSSIPSVIIVRTLGGQVGEDKMIEQDDAKFELGENVFLFLTKDDPFTDNSAGTHYRVTGWKFGKFSVTKDNQAIRPDLPKEHQKIALEELSNSIGAQ